MILDLLLYIFKGIGTGLRVFFWASYEYLFVILFVAFTHILLCKFFRVYEAVTYECSLAAVLLTLMNMRTGGLTFPNVAAFVICMLAFLLNALSQKHFYGKLKKIVANVLSTRDFDTKNKGSREDMTDIVSGSVVPSFSRFIEESKLLNNPANLFGLIKRTLSRDRFQKRKFLIREKSAELLNYTSFYSAPRQSKTVVNSAPKKLKKEAPGPIVTPEDLALDYGDEKKGLFSFDALGFGALIGSMIFVYKFSSGQESSAMPEWLFYLLLIAVGFISYGFRHIAFQRNNSLFTELACVAFFPVLYVFSTGTFRSSDWRDYVAFVIAAVLIFLVFFMYGRSGKIRLRKADEQFRKVLQENKRIKEDSAETRRVIRNCLEDLLFLCPSVLEPLSFRMLKALSRHGNKKNTEKPHEEHLVNLVREIGGDKENPFEPEDLNLSRPQILVSYGIIFVSLIVLCVTAFIYS